MRKDFIFTPHTANHSCCLGFEYYTTFRLNTDTGMALVFSASMRSLNNLARQGWAIQYVLRQNDNQNVELLLKKVSDTPLPYMYEATFFGTTQDALQSEGGIIDAFDQDLYDIVCYLRNYRDNCSLYLIRVAQEKETPDHE